jgi:uncharacterized protein YkwD
MFFFFLIFLLWSAESRAEDLRQYVDTINKRRRTPLEIDERLTQAARRQADFIAAQRYCEHWGFLGEDVAKRAMDYGYPWTIGQQLLVCGTMPSLFLKELFGTTHRKLILTNPDYNYIGIARAKNYYVVVIAK